ncbi:hypothetical protein V6N13_019669 [Hibiscus sabdariffa]
MGGVFKDDLIINEEVAADVAEKEKRQTEKLIDNTSERNVLVGQVVGLVENSGLVVKLVGGSNSNISESERMKRDRALKRRKWNKLHPEESELSGKSLSDSDISNRISKLVKEAKHVLKETKKLKLAEKDVREFWGDDDFGFCYSEAAGKSSGLLVVWDNKSLQLEDKAVCGGALILKDGTIRAMFSGPVTCKEWFGRDITVIKTALDVLKLAGWDKTREVAVESENKILLNWLANTLQRPWGLSKLLAEEALLRWALVVFVLLCLPYFLVTTAV